MRLNGLDLNKLEVFCSVIRNGGYRGASDELNLTRSAISQAIKSFENNLGLVLFDRVGTRMRPTQEAKDFYKEITLYQQGLQNSLKRLTQTPALLEGTLRIGSYLEFTKSQMVDIIDRFMKAHPKIQLKLVFDSPSRLDRLLENQKIDLSISIFPHRGMKSIVSEKLLEEELVLIGRKDLISEKPKADDLKRLQVVDYYQSHVLFKRWWKLHYDDRVSPTIRVFGSTSEMVLQLVRRGLGVGVVPRYVCESSLHRSELNIVQPTSRRLVDHIWLNRPRENSHHPVAEQFIKTLRDLS